MLSIYLNVPCLSDLKTSSKVEMSSRHSLGVFTSQIIPSKHLKVPKLDG